MPLDPGATPVRAFANKISKMGGPEVDMFAYVSSDLEFMAEAGRKLELEVVGTAQAR